MVWNIYSCLDFESDEIIQRRSCCNGSCLQPLDNTYSSYLYLLQGDKMGIKKAVAGTTTIKFKYKSLYHRR